MRGARQAFVPPGPESRTGSTLKKAAAGQWDGPGLEKGPGATSGVKLLSDLTVEMDPIDKKRVCEKAL
jgi:hypothetical protein